MSGTGYVIFADNAGIGAKEFDGSFTTDIFSVQFDDSQVAKKDR